MLGLSTSSVLGALLPGLVVVVIAAPLYGRLADRIGPRTVFAGTAASMVVLPFVWFPLLNTGHQGLMLLGFVLLFAGYAGNYAMFPVYFSEAFPISLRFSGMSIGFTIGTIAGNAFAPAISTWLLQSTGTWVAVAGYMATAAAVSLAAGLLIRRARSEHTGSLRQESGVAAA